MKRSCYFMSNTPPLPPKKKKNKCAMNLVPSKHEASQSHLLLWQEILTQTVADKRETD